MTLIEDIENTHTIAVLVDNEPGVLARVIGLFSGRGYNIECAHIVSDGVSTYADVDRICRDAVGFPMGPFELMDLTAVDVTHPATALIYNQFYHEPRYRPATLMQMQLDAGLLGRKVGCGFYTYTDGKPDAEPEAPAPAYDGRPVWISNAEPDAAAKLRAIVEAAGGKWKAANVSAC